MRAHPGPGELRGALDDGGDLLVDDELEAELAQVRRRAHAHVERPPNGHEALPRYVDDVATGRDIRDQEAAIPLRIDGLKIGPVRRASRAKRHHHRLPLRRIIETDRQPDHAGDRTGRAGEHDGLVNRPDFALAHDEATLFAAVAVLAESQVDVAGQHR